MSAFIRYQIINSIRSLRLIPPACLLILWIAILYAYKHVPVLSSYAISSIAMLLISSWMTMVLFSLEEESEKHILLSNLGDKRLYLLGKWLAAGSLIVPLLLFAVFYPIVLQNFKIKVSMLHYFLSFYSHITLALIGILVGTVFSATKLARKKHSWLSAVFVLAVAISYEAIVQTYGALKWILSLFPPVTRVIIYLNQGDDAGLDGLFWFDFLFVIGYLLCAVLLTMRLFLRNER